MSQDTVEQFDLSDAPDITPVYTNIGKLTLKQVYKLWVNGATQEVTREVFKAAADKQADGKGAKQVDMKFAVDLQEFAPNLQFTYDRDITVDGADWKKIVAPAIEEVMGKGSMVKGDTGKSIADTRNATLAKLNGKYVAFQDVPQVPRRNAAPGAKVYNTFKLTQVFESREKAYAAHVALRGASASANGAQPTLDANVPPDFAPADWYGLKGELQEAVAKALAEAQKKPKPIREKAMGEAKQAVLEKHASDWSATLPQIEHLLNS